MWPSDYPHERLPDMFERDIPEFLERDDISDEGKKAILHDNLLTFTGSKFDRGKKKKVTRAKGAKIKSLNFLPNLASCARFARDILTEHCNGGSPCD